MDRREFLKAAGAAAVWVLAGCSDEAVTTTTAATTTSTTGAAPTTSSTTSTTIAEVKRRPNIVLIMADDLGSETIGAYGGASYSTPVIDKMATEGLRFDHAYANPMCQPSRVKLLTGMYNHRNYIPLGQLPPGETTWLHALQAAGYTTCGVGKWQLNSFGAGTLPEKAGFDEYCMWNTDRARGEETAPMYWNPGIVQNGVALEDAEGRYGPDVFADYAIDFIERHRDESFMLYYPMVLAHAPHQPTPGDPDADPAIDPDYNDRTYFADQVEYIDGLVGRILEALERTGLREDTLVVFTGDNGTPPKIRSLLADGTEVPGGKATLTNAGLKVPLIARWPGTIEPGVTDAMMDFSDWFPTITEIAGADTPEGLDGVSFAPVLMGTGAGDREWIFVYFWRPRRDQGVIGWCVADREWKLYGDGRLIDLVSDRMEERPVESGASPEADAARVRLQAVLDEVLEGVDHDWPDPPWVLPRDRADDGDA